MVTVKLSDRETPKRASKWCKVCGRKHSRFDPCGLVEVSRVAKSGREVTHLVLPVQEA
jgi:ribosomal protein S14